MFKLGLDYHGVITEIPSILAPLTQQWCAAGNELHIITGTRITDDFVGKLEAYGIKYTHLFSISDYHHHLGTPMTGYDEGQPKIDPVIWNFTKAAYCETHKIDLHVDDSAVYEHYFTTPYARFVNDGSEIKISIKNRM